MTMRFPGQRVVLGITGASGAIYAEHLLRYLLLAKIRTYVVLTETAFKVIPGELGCPILSILTQKRTGLDKSALCALQLPGIGEEQVSELRVFDNSDLYAPIASGSAGATHMAVLPCSMGTLSRIAVGSSTCLLERAADVMLKERRKLIIVPRETPLSSIHLQNMLTLSHMGTHIIPAMPAFYQQPKTIEDMVCFVAERVWDALGLDTEFDPKTVLWNARRL